MGPRWLTRPGSLHLRLLCPCTPQAVHTQAGCPRRTPKQQPWERPVSAVRSWRKRPSSAPSQPPGAPRPLRVCSASRQLAAVESWPPGGPGPWSSVPDLCSQTRLLSSRPSRVIKERPPPVSLSTHCVPGPFAAAHGGRFLKLSLRHFEQVPSLPINQPGNRGTEPPGRAPSSQHSWGLDLISRNLSPKPPSLCGPL